MRLQPTANSRQLAVRSYWLLAVGCWLLSACGFEPIHGQHFRSQLENDLSTVIIEAGNGRFEQLLATEIEEGVNPRALASRKLFRLNIGLEETTIPLFINPDGTSGRGDIIYTSRYTLTSLTDGSTLHSGELTRVSSFNASQNADYASHVSTEDARKRAILELAEAYRLRLADVLPQLNGRAAPVIAAPPVKTNPLLNQRNPYETIRP
jgi:hypothetical protein